MNEYICIYDEDEMAYIPIPHEENTELVRCRLCERYDKNTEEEGLCDFWCTYVPANGFCHNRKRRGKMLNIPKPEHVPEAPPRCMGFKVGQYIIYHNGDRYEIGRVKEITKDGAFVSYTEGSGATLTLFSDMHPLFNAFCIEKTTLGGDFFGNSERDV